MLKSRARSSCGGKWSNLDTLVGEQGAERVITVQGHLHRHIRPEGDTDFSPPLLYPGVRWVVEKKGKQGEGGETGREQMTLISA